MPNDQNERDDIDQTSPDLGPSFEPDGAFLDDWSVVEDLADHSELMGFEPVQDRSPRSVDDIHRASWIDLDEVADAASSVILELLDDEFREASNLELEDETINELHRVIAEEPPESTQSEAPRRVDTQEIEILDEDEHTDPFDATGIQIVDVDTGEVVPIESGIYLIDDEASDRRKLAMSLAGVSSQIELPRPWGAYIGELRDEIVQQDDVRLRAAWIFIFGQLVRSLGAKYSSASPDVDISSIAGIMTRSDLLERVATHWRAADETFFEIISRLERLDEPDEGAVSALRRSSIARERLLDGNLAEESRKRLRDLVLPPENLHALVATIVDAHASGERTAAVEAWERLSHYTQGEMATGCVAITGWMLQSNRALLDVASRLLDDGWNSRPLLLMMQREAVRFGERLDEARALKRLVGLDVRLGKRLGDDGPRTRLKAETSSRLFRLATILDGLPLSELEGSDVEGMQSYDILLDAISINAKNPLFLRRLEVYARRRRDRPMIEKSLISLAAVVKDPHVRAVIWERIAEQARRSGAPLDMVRDHLERSLDAAPDCLPALISMGQHLISVGDFDAMLNLRGGPSDESRDLNLAWRRAELLERTKGDPVEILSLYRDARDDHPGSVHLFFCVERALARLGDWRGLRTLYESADAPESELRESLRATRFSVDEYRLAVETFLEDHDGTVSDAMVRHIDRAPTTPADDSNELRVDQNVLWRVIAAEIDEDPGRALGRLEVLLQTSRGKSPPWRLRALVWYAHLVENIMGEAEKALPAYREVFDRAKGRFLRRWAVRGLLRTGDASWVARHLADGGGPAWVDGQTDLVSFRRRMAAELMGMSADADQALDILEDVEIDEPVALAELAERATVLAIRSRQWVRAIPWMFRCYPEHSRAALAELARHLGAAYDDADAALRYIDEVKTRTPIDPYVILCELELAYRARDWSRALDLIEDGLGTIAAGSIDFRAFLLEQAILVAEWGVHSDERALTFLEDLWGLEATVGSSPIFGAAAFLRTYSRMKREAERDEHAEYVRKNFTPSVAEALLGEPMIYDEVSEGADAASWYAARIDSVPPPLIPYYRFMAAVTRWMFGERDRTSVQELADATAAGDPTHRVGPFLLAIAYRHADMYASCERQLAALRTPGNSRPVQDWVLVRQLFHLAVTQNQTREALELLRADTAFGQFAWFSIADELFARALLDPAVIPALRERAKTSTGARNLRLEIAEIEEDRETLTQLAEEELPEAVGQAEMLAAAGEKVSLPRWDIHTRHTELAALLQNQPPEDLADDVVAYLSDVEEELLGSPWCPIQLIRGDLHQFKLRREQQDSLKRRFLQFDDAEMGAEARLVLARHLLRSGRRKDAASLMPYGPTSQLISTAWALFNFALDPFTKDPKATEWVLDLWERRRAMSRRTLDAELDYEIGRYLELIGRPSDAIISMRRALSASPRFLPAQVSAGRLLIANEDWKGLASLWEAEMQFTEDVEALASVAFRLGYLWERRLHDLPDARRHAEDAYRRVLRVRPNHFPTLHALVGIAYDVQDWAAAAEYLEAIAGSCPELSLRASYLCELADIRETHLEDLPGACAAYRGAFEIDPESVDALFGVLRTDVDNHVAVDVIRGRLRHGVTQRELRDLSHHLFAATANDEAADDLLGDVAPTHFAWLTSRLIRAAEQGQLDAEASAELVDRYNTEPTRFMVDAFRRRVDPPSGDGPSDLADIARSIGAHPLAEGQLIRCMHFARQTGNLEALGTLAAVRARRSSTESIRAAELTWLAVTLMLRDEWEDALNIVEQLLDQVPNFLPAVKTAKFAADVSKNWEAVVRWFEADAMLTKVPEIASRDRLYASEVQRKHLGDYDAALSQLRTVLGSKPTHAEAFTKLREILLTKRQYGELLTAYETRLEHTKSDDEKSELLNQMGEIALNHVRDRPGAIGYFGRSIELRPGQLRRLRILSDLYEAEQRWDQAVVCHRASAELVDDPIMLARLWRHIGQLYESHLNDLKHARDAYARALRIDSNATEVLLALARVCENLTDYADAAALLSKVVSISRDPKVLLDARVGVARLQKRLGAPPQQQLSAIRGVLKHHPGHAASVDEAKKLLLATGMPGEAEDFFQDLTHSIIMEHGPRALPSAYEMAMNLQHRDRAFCISSIARELGVASPPMEKLLRDVSVQRRWPSKPLPADLTGGVLPEGLVAPFIELLRRSRDAVFEGMDHTPAQKMIKKGSRLKEPKNKATQLAFAWPALLGLELRDVHVVQGVPGHCAVHFDGGVRLVLDQKWLEVKDPTPFSVALGERLAGWSMGIGPWALLDPDAQQSLFIAIVSNYVRGWAQAERSHLPKSIVYARIQRWLDRKGQKVGPYALEISGRFGAAAIRQQFTLLGTTQKRVACLLIDDPGVALKKMGLLRAPEAGERPPWLFMLGAPAARVRKAVGVAVPE